MMATITLGGDVTSALTHFALLGAARLLEEKSPGSSRLWWSTDDTPRACLDMGDLDESALGEAIREQAREWARDGAWPQIQHHYQHGAKFLAASPFSPRIKGIDARKNPGEWDKHQQARGEVLDQLDLNYDWLSRELISSLGEPAYWREENKDPRPDHGASRWEMKTRNRGEEFVSHRFGPMCKEIAGWDVEAIVAGVTGRAVSDTIGKNSSSSRTSTGLTPPGAVDAALAFLGLIGISSFPMARRVHQINTTPCAYPTTSLHPTAMVLPVPVEPLTLARVNGIIESQELSVIVAEEGGRRSGAATEELALERVQAVQWLRSRQVPAVAVFTILLTGSASAPERQVQSGELRLL